MHVVPAAVDTALLRPYRNRLLQSVRLREHPAIRHGVTGRLIGAEPAEGNIGFSAPRDRAAAEVERLRWSVAAGIDASSVYTVHQVHGNRIIAVDRPRGESAPSLGQADAIMTATPGVAVMTLHADCLPIILADLEKPAVCTIHAGWRGTVADVAGSAVSAMQSSYGSDPSKLIAYFGPGMKACCYEVGDEVVEAWRGVAGEAAAPALRMGPRRWHFDLALANRWLLLRAGVSLEHIDDPGLCTMCHGDRWFSHRQQGPDTGRFGAIAGIALEHEGELGSWS